MGTLLSQFSMSHMPNLVFISAPELVPLTHTKGDLVLQAGLNSAPQHLPLKNDFKYDNHLSEDHHAAEVPPLPPMLSLANPLDSSKFLVASLMPFSRPSLVSNMFSLSL